ncbi:MAG TPA: hypothetical protein VK538_04540 [Solirubrobacteraceae bacterium]|nr:hypothetical protein [Solirubrobacteraceae bacterium]
MSVPSLGCDDPLQADEYHGEAAARLFDQAITACALVIPSGLRAECYSDDDSDGGGFILAVYPTSGSQGVTCGWRDVKNIACLQGDARPEDDRRLVKEALEFMASELNAALGVRRGRSSGA